MQVVEPDQIDILAFTVFGNLEQIDETEETRLARQLWSDVRKANRCDRVHFDLAFVHAVPGAHFNMGSRPYSNTASDFAATNSIAKSLGEHHEKSLPLAEAGYARAIAGVRSARNRALRLRASAVNCQSHKFEIIYFSLSQSLTG
jgi:hypothetical protein